MDTLKPDYQFPLVKLIVPLKWITLKIYQNIRDGIKTKMKKNNFKDEIEISLKDQGKK